MELEGLREEKLATTTAINVKRSLPQGSDAQAQQWHQEQAILGHLGPFGGTPVVGAGSKCNICHRLW